MSKEACFSELESGDVFWFDSGQYRKVPDSRTDSGESFNAVSMINGGDAPLLRHLDEGDEVTLVERHYCRHRGHDEPLGGVRQNQHGWGEP